MMARCGFLFSFIFSSVFLCASDASRFPFYRDGVSMSDYYFVYSFVHNKGSVCWYDSDGFHNVRAQTVCHEVAQHMSIMVVCVPSRHIDVTLYLEDGHCSGVNALGERDIYARTDIPYSQDESGATSLLTVITIPVTVWRYGALMPEDIPLRTKNGLIDFINSIPSTVLGEGRVVPLGLLYLLDDVWLAVEPCKKSSIEAPLSPITARSAFSPARAMSNCSPDSLRGERSPCALPGLGDDAPFVLDATDGGYDGDAERERPDNPIRESVELEGPSF